ncbi:hypothetical protein HMPREF1555_00617 [Porphyromonas gingivalis F0570]|uniref:Uncharacterized protein n=1 Tax=Porphyromonas gingivalis F0570 TaxID=1227271 RepID=A0A0E2LS20_PORGN|nr:hypothetical protein HMPREF1555_00617 [Porphyromonas gingivalis F0570]
MVYNSSKGTDFSMQPTLFGKIHGYFHSAREPLHREKVTIIPLEINRKEPVSDLLNEPKCSTCGSCFYLIRPTFDIAHHPCRHMLITCQHKNTNRKRSDCGTCFLKKWNRNFFVPARVFFTSRTKRKIFPRHVFRR